MEEIYSLVEEDSFRFLVGHRWINPLDQIHHHDNALSGCHGQDFLQLVLFLSVKIGIEGYFLFQLLLLLLPLGFKIPVWEAEFIEPPHFHFFWSGG